MQTVTCPFCAKQVPIDSPHPCEARGGLAVQPCGDFQGPEEYLARCPACGVVHAHHCEPYNRGFWSLPHRQASRDDDAARLPISPETLDRGDHRQAQPKAPEQRGPMTVPRFSTTPMRRADLDAQECTCGRPDCSANGPATITCRCAKNPEAPVLAIYEQTTGHLVLRCPVCKNEIIRIAVAQ